MKSNSSVSDPDSNESADPDLDPGKPKLFHTKIKK
jgi:hypothetical protein